MKVRASRLLGPGGRRHGRTRLEILSRTCSKTGRGVRPGDDVDDLTRTPAPRPLPAPDWRAAGRTREQAGPGRAAAAAAQRHLRAAGREERRRRGGRAEEREAQGIRAVRGAFGEGGAYRLSEGGEARARGPGAWIEGRRRDDSSTTTMAKAGKRRKRSGRRNEEGGRNEGRSE